MAESKKKGKKPAPVKNKSKTGNGRDAKGRFLPGAKRKPGPGRPKKEKCIPDILNSVLDEEVRTKDGLTLTKREAILRSTVKDAMRGDRHARQFVADRSEGKAVDRIIRKDGALESGKDWREVMREYADKVDEALEDVPETERESADKDD